MGSRRVEDRPKIGRAWSRTRAGRLRWQVRTSESIENADDETEHWLISTHWRRRRDEMKRRVSVSPPACLSVELPVNQSGSTGQEREAVEKRWRNEISPEGH